MKKPVKVLSAASLATLLASSTLVPVAVQAAESEVPASALVLDKVVLKTEDGKLGSLSYQEDFVPALAAGLLKQNEMTHVGVEEGSFYKHQEDFVPAYVAMNGDVKKTLELLYKEEGQDKDSKILEGYIDEDGTFKVKEDEQPSEEVNKDALNKAIAEATALEGEQAAAVADALAAAKKVADNEDATQEEVDAAAEALNKAIDDATGETPEEPADKAALEEAIAKAEKADTEGKTDESVKALKDAIAAANAVLKDEEADEKAIADAIAGLEAAVAGLTDAEEPAEDKIAVAKVEADNISAPNQVTVTFPKAAEGEEVTAEDLAKTTITLTDEEGNELTATFKDLTKDGKAIYEVEEDLVDAKKYTPTSEDLALPADPVIAKVAEEFVAEFTTDTTSVSDKSKDIQLNLLNQYGEPASDKAVVAAGNNIKVTGTLNGMPLTAEEITVTGNVVTVHKDLVAGNKLVFTVQNVKTEKDKEPVILASNDFEFTIAEGEAPAPSKIVGITATKTVDGKEVTADEVLPKDVVTLEADLRDQYNNKVTEVTTGEGNEKADLIRWVVTAGKDVVTFKEADKNISTVDTDELTVDYTALKAGKATITAFNIANGAKYEYKVEVGATPLEKVEFEVTNVEEHYNNEEAKIAKVKSVTDGAILTPDMIDFEVTPGEGLAKDDIKVVAEYAKDKDGKEKEGKEKEEIIVKATTTKAGTYKVKPVVKAADKEVKVTGEFEVKTTINPNVAEISEIEFDEKELKSNATIKKPIVLKNKHGEVLTMEDFTEDMKQYVSLTSNNEGVIKSEGIQIVGGDTEETANDTYLEFSVEAEAKGVTILTVQSTSDTKVFQTYALEFTEPVLTTIDAGKDVKGVVAGDGEDKAVYNELKFLDQDGLETAKPDNAKVIVTDSANQVVEGENGTSLAKIVEGEFNDKGEFEVKAGTGKYFVKVQPGKDLKGTYTVTVTVTNGKEKDEDAKEYVADSFKVEVNEARKAAKFVVKPTATTIAKGASADFLIELQDQYDEAFDLPTTNDEQEAITVVQKGLENDQEAAIKVDKVDKVNANDKGEAVKGLYKFTAKVDKLADAKDYTLVVTVPTAEDQDPITKEITVKVDAGSNLAKSLEITGENIENGKAVLPIKAVANEATDSTDYTLKNNAGGNYKLGLNVLDEAGEKINYLDSDVEWSSKTEGVTIEEVEEEEVTESVIKVTDKVFEEGKDTATITLNAKYFGIDQDIELEVSKADRAIQEGTLQATQKVEDEVSTVVSVEIDKDATDGQIEVTYTGTDQFGKEYEALTEGLSVKSFDTSVATVADPTTEGKVVITAVKEGNTQIEATIDNVTHMLDVIVTKEAAKAAADKADVETAKGQVQDTYEVPFEAENKLEALTTLVKKDVTVEGVEVEVAPKTTKEATEATHTVTLTKGDAKATKDITMTVADKLPTGVSASGSLTKSGKDAVDEEAGTEATYTYTVSGQELKAGTLNVKVGDESEAKEVTIGANESGQVTAEKVATAIAEAINPVGDDTNYTVKADGAKIVFEAKEVGVNADFSVNLEVAEEDGVEENQKVGATLSEGVLVKGTEKVDQVEAEAAVYDLTVTAGATNDGTLEIKAGDTLLAEVAVTAGQDATAVAQAIATALSGNEQFEVKAEDAKVTFTAQVAKEQSDLKITVADKEETPAGE